MPNPNEVKTAISAVAAKPQVGIQSLIEKSMKELGRALPAHLNANRLVRIALTCIRVNPDLAKCTPESFLGALFTSAQLGVEPVAGRAYILPFNNKRKKPDGAWHTIKEAQFVMGYKGLADLFYRHEKAVQLDWGIVCANDEFSYEKGTHAYLKHKPSMGERGPAIGYYVVATLTHGGKPFEFMSKAQALDHGKKHSKTYDRQTGKFYDSSPWTTAEDSMCLKTVLIQLAKILPLSVELQRAIAADETSRELRKGVQDVLEIPDTTTWSDPVEAEAVHEDAGTAIEPGDGKK